MLTAEKPQHMQALDRANVVRLARADLKRAVQAGLPIRQALDPEFSSEAQSMPIFELLRSQRLWGKHRARRLLQDLGISESRPIGVLTPRQRSLIILRLDEAA